MPSSSTYPSLDRSPKANWVEKVGGLPDYIERIAKHLHYESGFDIGRSIATAVNACKKMCTTGDLNFPGKQNVNAGSRAQACSAVAEWEAKKAKARSLATPTDEFSVVMLAAMRMDDVVDLALPPFLQEKIAKEKGKDAKCKACGKPATMTLMSADGKNATPSCADCKSKLMPKNGKAVALGGKASTGDKSKAPGKAKSKPPWEMSDRPTPIALSFVQADTGHVVELARGKIRRVRTPAGVAWYKQPIGSIIIPDVVPGKPGRVLSVGQPVNAGGKNGRILDVTPDGERLRVRHDDGTVHDYLPGEVNAPGERRSTPDRAGAPSAGPGTRVAGSSRTADDEDDEDDEDDASNNRLDDETPEERRRRREERDRRRRERDGDDGDADPDLPDGDGGDDNDDENDENAPEEEADDDSEEGRRRRRNRRNKKNRNWPGGGGLGGPGLPHGGGDDPAGGAGTGAGKGRKPAAGKKTGKKVPAATRKPAGRTPTGGTRARPPVAGRTTPLRGGPDPSPAATVQRDLQTAAPSAAGGTSSSTPGGDGTGLVNPALARARTSDVGNGLVLVVPGGGGSSTDGTSTAGGAQSATGSSGELAQIRQGLIAAGYSPRPDSSGRGLIVAAGSATTPQGVSTRAGSGLTAIGDGTAPRAATGVGASPSGSGLVAGQPSSSGGVRQGGTSGQGSPAARTSTVPVAPLGDAPTAASRSPLTRSGTSADAGPTSTPVQLLPSAGGTAVRASDQAAVQRALQEKNPTAAIAPLRRMLASPGLSEGEKARYNALLANAQGNAPGATDPGRPESPQLGDFLSPAEQSRFADLTGNAATTPSPADTAALNGLKAAYLARKAAAAGLPADQARAAATRANALLAGFNGGTGPTAQRLLAALGAVGAPEAGVSGDHGDDPTNALARAISDFNARGGSGEPLDRLAVAAQREWSNAAHPGAGGQIKLNRAVYGDQAATLLQAHAAGQPWDASTRVLSSWAELLGMPSVDAWLDANPGVAWLTQDIPATKVFAFWRAEPVLRHPNTFALGEYVIIGQEVSSGTATVAGG